MGFRTQLKFSFKWEPKPLLGKLRKAEKVTLKHFGGIVRKHAYRSMKRPKMKTVAQLTAEEKERYETAKRIRRQKPKHQRGKLPKRPYVRSKPGKPPAVWAGHLKALLRYEYDSFTQSLVVGPLPFSGSEDLKAPRTLEQGGYASLSYGPRKGQRFYVQPRPYMQPALDAHLPKLEPLWRDRLNKF